MLMADSPGFVTVYLAAMRIGAIPVPVSTMLRADGLAELLADSRARFLAVTREFAGVAAGAAAAAPELAGILADRAIAEGTHPGSPAGQHAGWTVRHKNLSHHRGLAGLLAVHLGYHRGSRRPRCTGTVRSRSYARPDAPRCSASRRRTGGCPRPKAGPGRSR